VSGPPIPLLYVEMDGTGVPVVAARPKAVPAKSKANRRVRAEVKLGCVFHPNASGPGRPADSRPEFDDLHRAIENAESFGRRIYTEALRRGWDRALKKVVLADGAIWIWVLAELLFPGALQIVDLYHARDTFGTWRRNFIRTTNPAATLGHGARESLGEWPHR